MYALENVSVRRHQQCVLIDAQFVLNTGEMVAVIGPNGAGKSTLLQALSGDLPAHAGHVTLDDRALQKWDINQLAQRRAVFTQADSLRFPFTVGEVVMLGRMPQQQLGTAQDHSIVQAALRSTDTLRFSQRRYTELSGGERARVRLARALAQLWPQTSQPQQASYLLLDEPLAAMDLHYQYHMLEMLRSHVSSRLGMLVVMHDLSLAARYADRVVLLDQGRLVADGCPEQVLTAERLSQHYRLPMKVLNLPGSAYPIITADDNLPTVPSAA